MRRQTLGWSLAEVGERCGIDERFIGAWERGCDSPRLEAVESWAAALGVELRLLPDESEARPGLRIDWQDRHVSVDGVPVRLTPMEWKALERLACVPGELVPHQVLFRHLYGEERPYRAQSTAVRVLITKLRRLLPLRIEAQWGRGYRICDLDPSPPRADAAEAGRIAAPSAASAPARAAPHPRHDQVDLDEGEVRQFSAGLPRSEELGVIERFLAERGATRCPDVATIQKSPLPTLVWDKVKRKWVRPPTSDRAAS